VRLFAACSAFISASSTHVLGGLLSTEFLEKGQNHRVVQTVSEELGPDGSTVLVTNRYVELADDLHFLNAAGQWELSRSELVLFPGGAVGETTPHKLILAPTLRAPGGCVDLLAPDGGRFRASPVFLSLYDPATGQSVLIADVQDVGGQLVEKNVVEFPGAFGDDVQGAIRFTYTEHGLEQEVLLWASEGLDPADYQFPADCLVEVWSEVFESPAPQKRRQTLPNGLVDEALDLGAVVLPRGKTFVSDQPGESIGVAKLWIDNLEGRRFLVESVRHVELRPLLDRLGRQARAGAPAQRLKRLAEKKPVPDRRQLLAQAKTPARTKEPVALMARAEPGRKRPGRGVHIDYTILNADKTDYTFAGDVTTYVTASVTLYGTSTWESGTVLKFAPGARLQVNGPINWQGTAHRPVVLTARDHHGIGEKIGSAPLNGYYAETALHIDAAGAGTNATIQHVRVCHATSALAINGGSGHKISHVQLVNCLTGLHPTNTDVSLLNGLLHNVFTNFDGTGSTVRGEHLTINTADWMNFSNRTSVVLTNSLLVAVTYAGSYSGSNNQSNSSPSATFQTVGAGQHYLLDNTYRNQGTTNVSILAEIRKMTTYPPVVLSNDFLLNTTLSPQAQRDTDLPDLGAHYVPLDWCWSGLNLTNSTLLLTNGVAVAHYGTVGTTLRTGAKFLSEGSPVQMNRIVRYHAVQEQPVIWGSDGTTLSLMNISASSPLPEVRVRFTDVALMADTTSRRHLLGNGNQQTAQAVGLTHCWLRGPYLYLSPNASGMNAGLTNNFMERAYCSFNQSASVSFNLQLRHNLVWRGTLAFYDYHSATTWAVHENLFDTVSMSGGGTTNSYNGYYNTSWADKSPTGNVTLTVADYQAGPLSKYYYPTNGASGGLTNLFDAGSRLASSAGLFHFTTTTNQVKEGSSQVDIGWHVVAVDAAGQPLDYELDGLGDFLEDRNGNGVFDSGETDWQSYNSLFGIGSGPGLVVFTPLKP
jgi:hypothetical protein